MTLCNSLFCSSIFTSREKMGPSGAGKLQHETSSNFVFAAPQTRVIMKFIVKLLTRFNLCPA